MEALDILEKRIDTLSRMLGTVTDVGGSGQSSTDSTPATENVVDSLISAQTLLNGATNGREQINKTFNRTGELEKYLEPNFLEDNQQVRSKEVYLNAVSPELHAQFEQLELCAQLEPTLGAEYFRNIPGECIEKLKQFNADNVEFAQQSELIEERLIGAMKQYGEIQTGIMESLGAMTKRLEFIEEKIAQKKREELNKELPAKEETVEQAKK